MDAGKMSYCILGDREIMMINAFSKFWVLT